MTPTLLGVAAGALSVAIAASVLGSVGSEPERPRPSTPSVPEGRLVLRRSGIEVLEQADRGSVPLGGEPTVTYELSPDGSRVLAATYVHTVTNYSREDKLLTIDLSTGERSTLARAAPTEELGPAVWSPDGARVVYRLTVLPVDPARRRPQGMTEQTLCVVEVSTTTLRCFPDLGTVDAFAWSPDGRRIVVDGVGADLPLRLIDVATGGVSDFVSPHDPDLVAALGGQPPPSFVLADWSPSGKYVATHTQSAAAVFDSEGRFVMLGQGTRESSEVFTWSPTQDLLAYAAGRPPYAITDLYVLDPATGDDHLVYSTGEGERAPIILDAAWSPSGRWIAVATSERTIRSVMTLHIIDVTGGGPGSVLPLGPSDLADVLIGWGP